MSWRRLFRRSYWDAERAREMEAHLAIETDENIARGMEPVEARRAACRKLGNPALIREEIYRMNSIGFLETLWQDLKYGARGLRLNPGFAIVAILSLALGIGANTAIFQLLDAVRLRALPVQRPQELANIRIENGHAWSGSFTGPHPSATYPQFEQIRDRQQGFSGVFAWSTERVNLAPNGRAEYAWLLWASGNTFDVLGIRPVLGRTFAAAEDRKGCGAPGAVISYGFWQSHFGGDAGVIGRTLTLEGHPFEVIGVVPGRFYGLEVGQKFDVAVPLCAEPVIKGEDTRLERRDAWWLVVMGRLKPGWSRERAGAQLAAISPSVFQETLPAKFNGDRTKNYLSYRLGAVPGGTGLSTLRKDYEQPLWLLLATAGVVLLIACANLANLLLARASAREREIGVRLALGASRARLIRQLLEESLMLACTGAALGTGLALLLSRFLVSFLSTTTTPLFLDLRLDWRVFGFTAAVAILTCLLFGLAPALRATEGGPAGGLKIAGRGVTAGRERLGLRRALVVIQVALSLVLLAGALLFTRSLRNLLVLDAGFQQNGILVLDADLTALKLPPEQRFAFKQEMLDRVRRIHGVEAAALTYMVPLGGNFWNDWVWQEDETKKEVSSFHWVTPGYLQTMRMPLLAGRDFTEHDDRNAPKVAVVSQSFARKVLKTANPVGKTFRQSDFPDNIYEVVGLVPDTKYFDIREDFEPVAFLPMAQQKSQNLAAIIMIRSNGALAALPSALKNTVEQVSPAIGFDFRVVRQHIRESLVRESMMATLSGFFGLLAGLLATIGLYGVISYMVARRRNEIGIRMALGANRGRVLGLVMREASVLIGIGLAVGTALAAVTAKSARALLFNVKPNDPFTLAAAVGILAAVSVAASYLPARRAARIDPMVALRDE